MRKPSLREWVNDNRAELSDRFVEKYGNQIQEWADFTENEFNQAFRGSESNLSLISAGDYSANEPAEEMIDTSGPRS